MSPQVVGGSCSSTRGLQGSEKRRKTSDGDLEFIDLEVYFKSNISSDSVHVCVCEGGGSDGY